MNSLDSYFRFHPIGQGCFYTGKLVVNGNRTLPFNFVYDCGSNSEATYLNDAIDWFKDRNLETETLDLLIISHFDADHVCGVVKLLEKIHCKRLVIPYYEFQERLMLLITSVETSDDYLQMLQSPIVFFSGDRFRIDEIILVGGPDNEEDNEDNVLPKPPDRPSFQNIEAGEQLQLNPDCVMQGESERKAKERLKETEALDQISPQLKLLKKPFQLQFQIWEFRFYLKKHDNLALMARFKKDVDELLKGHDIDIFDIFNDDYLTELKKIYRVHYGENLNNTSLIAYHGPMFSNTARHFHYCHYDYCEWVGTESVGTLLTGDIDISSTTACNKLVNYFNGYINDIGVFQVPHHGAKANWPFRNAGVLNTFYGYVINHGLGRIHHPSTDVIKDIKTRSPNAKIYLNNEVQDFRYGWIF